MAGPRTLDPMVMAPTAPHQPMRGVPLPTVNQLGKVLTNHWGCQTASHKVLCQNQGPNFQSETWFLLAFHSCCVSPSLGTES